MGNDKLRRILEQVTNSLTPSRLEFEVEDGDVLNLLVVSEQFSGMPISKRFEKLSALFEKHGTEILQEFTLIFQAWTQAEVIEMKLDDSYDSESNDNKKNSRAAKPAEL